MGEDSMVERVARAMWEVRRRSAKEDGVDLEEWGDGSVPRDCGVMDEARAALETMRKPTAEMWDRARPHMDSWSSNAAWWQAMIAASLNDA